MGSTRARTALVCLGAIVLAGCEEHTLTRPPDPPLGASGWVLIWIAVGSLLVGWTAHGLRLLVGRRHLSTERWGLGGAFVASGLVLTGTVAFDLASAWRERAILDGLGCRRLPMADRPHQIIQLTCSDSVSGLEWLGVVLVAPVVLLCLGCTLMAVRGPARPVLPTVVAGACVGGLAAALIGAGGTWTAGEAVVWAIATAVAVATTACGVRELRRPQPVPPPVVGVPPRTGPIPAGVLDRTQAFTIDGLLLLVPLLIYGNATSGALEIVGCLGLVAVYAIGTTASWGATLGKRFLRLRVVADGTGEAPSAAAAALRYLTLLAPPVLIVAVGVGGGLIVVWFGVVVGTAAAGDHLAVHDRAAGTRVVRLP